MNIAQIENNIKALVEHLVSGELATNDFIYELLLAYGHRNSTISMLKTGHYNIAKEPDEIIFKRHLYFKEIKGEALHSEIDRMKSEKLVIANRTRFVIVTNFHTLLAVDTKTGDSLDIVLVDLPKKFDFFLPWAGMEKAVYQGENPADVKAAEKMAKLFDLIKADNFTEETIGDKAALHNLNVFLTRLLFCFFAEDTEIFANNQFSNAIQENTIEDGTDLADYLNRLFVVLNTSDNERGDLPEYLAKFPYVNGGLFADDVPSPKFSRKSRRMLIECGSELNWSDINPDIFGSMFQAVVHPDQRGGMGMHYTSVTNIMKVIEPLFLTDLYDELDNVSNTSTKLQKLQQRLGEIKIFDPACGSGNFLIIAYKELRRLEMELLKRWQELELGKTGQVFQPYSVINVSQFYGIELDDFAHEVAILSLWLAEHQMNREFRVEFGDVLASLPLKRGGNVHHGNATHLNWFDVCPNNGEVYIIGNPPYAGQKNQNDQHKKDLDIVFKGQKDYKKLDYISCWFYLASSYIHEGQSFAFVTTNSICQGTQVDMLWPKLFLKDIEIIFSYSPFKWANNAKDNAGVTCTIIGVSKNSGKNKFIYDSGVKRKVRHINAYLVDGSDIIVQKRNMPIAKLPKMQGGNQPREGGYLMLSDSEKQDLVKTDYRISEFIRPLMGSNEFIKGTKRWCIWIKDKDLEKAKSIPIIDERINKVYEHRVNGNSVEKSFSRVPHKFVTTKTGKNSQIIVPIVSSDRREYIPIGILPINVVVTSKAYSVFDAPPYILGLLTSRMHMVWVRAVSGRLGMGFSYSSNICWNTFPLPDLSENEISDLNELSLELLSIREEFPEFSISDLYDPEKMPDKLRSAHNRIDCIVDSFFANAALDSDEKRLSVLFNKYAKLMELENA